MVHSLVLMDCQGAANKMDVNSIWNGGGMVNLLTLEWREMELVLLLWALLLKIQI